MTRNEPSAGDSERSGDPDWVNRLRSVPLRTPSAATTDTVRAAVAEAARRRQRRSTLRWAAAFLVSLFAAVSAPTSKAPREVALGRTIVRDIGKTNIVERLDARRTALEWWTR